MRIVRAGVLFAPDNKDIAIFGEKVGRSYARFHRPSTRQIGPPAMWLAFSDDLLDGAGHASTGLPHADAWPRVGAEVCYG